MTILPLTSPPAVFTHNHLPSLDTSTYVQRLLNALSLASQAILLLDQPNKDPEDIKEAFEEKCVILGNVITVI
ncbi:hypothetical protein BSLG_009404 [Batrachochytrium salamandrivorans]|nr:hypothetical protein BSLG_009404 [Batrachochytrium salamandrivorans]